MRFIPVAVLSLQLATVFSAPTPKSGPADAGLAAEEGAVGGEAGGDAGGEEAGEENEVELEAEFGVPVTLQGGDLKQDILFAPGVNGLLEIEFQNAQGRTLTVTENANPAAAPAGFLNLENVSYKVDLAEGANGLTLQKIDYILNAGNDLDISQGQIGRFCAEVGAFVIDPAVGELEFEVEENELTLTVDNMNAEWAVFVPDAAAGGDAAGGQGNGVTLAPGEVSTGSDLLDAIVLLLGQGAAGAESA